MSPATPLVLCALAVVGAKADTLRTLDEISIEGEVSMPQVWFVTARELPRYHDRVEWLLEPRASSLEPLLSAPVVVWPQSSWALPESLAFIRQSPIPEPNTTR